MRTDAWYKANRAKLTEQARIWRAANPGRALAATLRWRAKNPEKVLLMVAKARGVDLGTILPKTPACEVCGSAKKICLDHDHQTRRFRGWICDRCNTTLGRVSDDPVLLRKLADYLVRKAG